MKFKLVRPTVNTPFHIDWGWFEQNQLDPESAVRRQLCYRCQQQFEEGLAVEEVDYVDPESGEVLRMDNLRESILAHCREQRDYISEETPLMQSVFRLFLANNNTPLTPQEIAHHLSRADADTILRVLTSGVKSGVVPLRD